MTSKGSKLKVTWNSEQVATEELGDIRRRQLSGRQQDLPVA